ncbi:interleukin-10 receptor subunit beta [Plectropomus leopardus]|uniref:interleukin-10 receptor subunit beta n=1 Tax=Plectropomus leopardus TaxID=160734 RepID=UPI001C4BBA36|nr:interleukin-10 receptor subunit beta [Plectropomus leopardus]
MKGATRKLSVLSVASPREKITMSTAFYACLLLLCLQTSAEGSELTPPENLTMITLNTNYTLSWDWDRSSADNHAISFTTQYVAKYKLKSKKKRPTWYTACEETSERSCDLTKLNLYYLGIYMLRVRASVNGSLSNWALKEFCPDKDAAVGPPSKVDLSLDGSVLDINISDPLTSTNSSMKDHLEELYYHIIYWERSEDTQMLTSKVNMVTLSNLKAWTWYCVSVQSRYDFYNKSSSFTPPNCIQTEGAVPWWQVFGYFLVSLVICFLIMLLLLCCFFWFYKTLKSTFFPSIQLPSHFEYLYDSPGSDIPRLLTSDSDSGTLCNKVTICPEPPVLEIHEPPPEVLPVHPSGLEPDSSGRHSRQDSSGSGDSGVYSTGGSSSLRQPSSSQSSVQTEDSGQGPFDSEQVKMQDMAPRLKTHLLIADEGIVDLCV